METIYFNSSWKYSEGKCSCLHKDELCQNMPKKEEKSKYYYDFSFLQNLNIYIVSLNNMIGA